MSDYAQNLRQAAEEIRREGHAGWGNACEWAADEIERLTAALQYEQHRADRQGTHGDGCADWGPAHYECAIRERDDHARWRADLADKLHDRETTISAAWEALRSAGVHSEATIDDGICLLRRQLAEAEQDARRYRWIAGHCRSTSEHWGGRWSIVVEGPCPAKHDEEGAFDDAIDAAMGLTRPAEES